MKTIMAHGFYRKKIVFSLMGIIFSAYHLSPLTYRSTGQITVENGRLKIIPLSYIRRKQTLYKVTVNQSNRRILKNHLNGNIKYYPLKKEISINDQFLFSSNNYNSEIFTNEKLNEYGYTDIMSDWRIFVVGYDDSLQKKYMNTTSSCLYDVKDLFENNKMAETQCQYPQYINFYDYIANFRLNMNYMQPNFPMDLEILESNPIIIKNGPYCLTLVDEIQFRSAYFLNFMENNTQYKISNFNNFQNRMNNAEMHMKKFNQMQFKMQGCTGSQNQIFMIWNDNSSLRR